MRFGASRFNEAGLCFAHGTDNAVDEALALVLHALHLPARPPLPAELFHARLTRAERREVRALLRRRIEDRVPAPYLTGEAWFAGLRFEIDRRVLVPRSPLAELIEEGFQPWLDGGRVRRILDLGTGSGCIAVACAYAFPDAQVDAADASPGALEVARRNVSLHDLEGRVRVLESDLFEGLARATDSRAAARYDLVVSNPPYVPDEELAGLPPEFGAEPALALAGGPDGLDVVGRIVEEAPRWLAPEGALVVEVGASPIVRAALESRFDLPFVWLDAARGAKASSCCTGATSEAKPGWSSWLSTLVADRIRTRVPGSALQVPVPDSTRQLGPWSRPALDEAAPGAGFAHSLQSPSGTHSSRAGRDSRGRQHLRNPLHGDLVRGEPRPRDRVRGGRVPTRPRSRRVRPPARPRPAGPRPEPPHHPAPRGRRGADPLRRLRGGHHRDPDRPPHRERRREEPRLLEDPGRVPARPRRLHLPRQVRGPRLPGRRPCLRPRDRGPGGGGRDREEVPPRAVRVHGAGLARPARAPPTRPHRPRRGGPQSLLLSRSEPRSRARTLHDALRKEGTPSARGSPCARRAFRAGSESRSTASSMPSSRRLSWGSTR